LFQDKGVIKLHFKQIKQMTTLGKFNELVAECTNNATSDLSTEIRAMLLYAQENASESEKADFLEWLGSETIWDNKGVIETSKPEDNFECMQGMSWSDLIEYYESL